MSTATYDLCGQIMSYEEGALGDRATLALFSYLIKSGQAWTLQGHYGRAAKALIEGGWIDQRGNILRRVMA